MLLVDSNDFEYQIVEDTQGKPLRVSGIFQKCQEKNANGRVYTRSLWEKVLNDEKTKRRLKERRILGELDHPKDGKTSLMRAAMVITDLALQDDGFVRGVYEVLNTPSGQVLRELHRAGVRLGISSRGDGEVESTKEGQVVIPESYRFETFDVVLDPSVEEAYPTVLREAIETARKLEEEIFEESLPGLVEKFESLTKQIKEACACHLTEGRPIYNKQGWVLGTCRTCGSKNYVEPHGTTADCRKCGVPTEHENIPPERREVGGLRTKESRESTMNVMETQEYKDLLAQKTKLEAELAAEKKRADAAVATAEELLVQARTAQWNAGHMKESLDKSKGLSERYEIAKSIIEEMADELRVMRRLKHEMKALKKVAASMYEYIQDARMAESVRGMLGRLPKQVRESLLPVLERCQSETEAKAVLAPIVEQVCKPERLTAAKKSNGVPSWKEIKENDDKEAGKPLLETAPPDKFQPPANGGRVIAAMSRDRADVIALTRALIEHRTRQGLHQS